MLVHRRTCLRRAALGVCNRAHRPCFGTCVRHRQGDPRDDVHDEDNPGRDPTGEIAAMPRGRHPTRTIDEAEAAVTLGNALAATGKDSSARVPSPGALVNWSDAPAP